MRVFVLTTGRSGSVTFARACNHATNYTAAHESRIGEFTGRFDYPDQHIEVDNRLVFLLGLLHQHHPDAFYIHLTRDPAETAASYIRRTHLDLTGLPLAKNLWRRWRGYRRLPLVDAFNHGIIEGTSPVATADLMVEAMNANIVEYLRDKPHLTLDISDAAERIGEVWARIGAEGDLEAARREFGTRHNASR